MKDLNVMYTKRRSTGKRMLKIPGFILQFQSGRSVNEILQDYLQNLKREYGRKR